MSKRAEIHVRNRVLTVLLMVSMGASAETLTGTVVGVTDGDTITVMDAQREPHKVRLAGIDAPEKNQPFGQRAKDSLSTLVFGKDVEVRWHKHDRYDRLVGKVMVAAPDCRGNSCPRTLDAGLAQITVGLAWWYQKYAKEQSVEDAHRYEFAEQEARAKHAGLWMDPQPTPPWEWRKAEH